MRARRIPVALVALSIPLLAGGAFAAANAVSTTPGPQVIIPSKTASNTPTSAPHANRGPGHDDATTPTTPTTADDHGNDAPGHDVNDDRGHDGTTVTTPTTVDDRGNDGAGHDANDDHGHDHGDDRGDSGSSNSGPGSSGSGH